MSGIQFAVQLVLLLTIGPFADYGTWRPWIMIVFQVIVYICTFSMIGITRPDQWEAALALHTLASLCKAQFLTLENNPENGCADPFSTASNIVGAFYSATFPGLVRDLPKLIQSEQEVLSGEKRSVSYTLAEVVDAD